MSLFRIPSLFSRLRLIPLRMLRAHDFSSTDVILSGPHFYFFLTISDSYFDDFLSCTPIDAVLFYANFKVSSRADLSFHSLLSLLYFLLDAFTLYFISSVGSTFAAFSLFFISLMASLLFISYFFTRLCSNISCYSIGIPPAFSSMIYSLASLIFLMLPGPHLGTQSFVISS